MNRVEFDLGLVRDISPLNNKQAYIVYRETIGNRDSLDDRSTLTERLFDHAQSEGLGHEEPR